MAKKTKPKAKKTGRKIIEPVENAVTRGARAQAAKSRASMLPPTSPWKVVLTKLEKEFSTEAEARRFFDLRTRSLASGERLAIIKHPA